MKQHARHMTSLGLLLLAELLMVAAVLSVYWLRLEDFQDAAVRRVADEYAVIASNVEELGRIYFEELIDQPHVTALMRQANADEAQRPHIRQQLLEYYQPLYQRMRRRGVRQFHFHLRDSSSLLRMHRPEKWGDSLMGIRYSVEHTNHYLKSSHGFEEGRIYNGFRNVFPLFHEGDHVGSVELSLSFDAVRIALERTYGSRYGFMVSAEVVDQRVFDAEKEKNYLKLPLTRDFYFERPFVDEWREDSEFFHRFMRIGEAEAKQLPLREFQPFTHVGSDAQGPYALIFLPISNIQGQTTAYILAFGGEQALRQLQSERNGALALGMPLVLLLLVALYYLRQRRHLELARRIIDTQSQMLLIADGQTIVSANRSFLDFFAIRHLNELTSRYPRLPDLLHQTPECKAFDGACNKVIPAEFPLRQVTLKGADGRARVFQIDVKALALDAYRLATFHDITLMEEEKQRFRHLSVTDTLTQLLNRDKFDLDLRERLRSVAPSGSGIAILLIDVDHFKAINDRHGHPMGDQVLMRFAVELRTSVRRNDRVYRWGGEEFVILIDADLPQALLLAEKLRSRIACVDFPHGEPLTCSIGVHVHEPGEGPESLLLGADEALYRAKQTGRNRVEH